MIGRARIVKLVAIALACKTVMQMERHSATLGTAARARVTTIGLVAIHFAAFRVPARKNWIAVTVGPRPTLILAMA